MKFCAVCGRSQQEPAGTDGESFAEITPTSESGDLWTESLQYEYVLRQAESRQRIAAAARQAGQGVTGDDLLALFDAVSPINISIGNFTRAILPIYDKLGIKTDRQAQTLYRAPAGRVLLATLCALATKSLTVAEVHQESVRCSLSSELPSGLIMNRGKLHVLLTATEGSICVTLAALPGHPVAYRRVA